MDTDPLWPSLLIIFFLLVFYAFCTACETALDGISDAGRNRLAEREDTAAKRLVKLVDEPDTFQSGVHLAALAAETGLFSYGIASFYGRFGLERAMGIALAAVILACLLWLFGRMLPRQIALGNPEGVALALCGPFLAVTRVLLPVTTLFLLIAKGILAVLRIKPKSSAEDVSEDEIRAMVDIGQESGVIEADEKQMIENVFEFNNMTAEDVMIHRTDVEMISLEDSREEILALVEESGRSRFPVYREDADDIVGILSAKDFLLNLQKEHPKALVELLRPAYFVPESVRTDVLFQDMQSRAVQMAIVVDEYGGTSGLVTLEDLLEELVGNIYDEFDVKEEQEIVPLEENLWRVAGSVDLETLAEHLDLELPEEEELADTLGGLVFACLSVIPEDGATPKVEAMGLSIQVEVLRDRRVEWALVSKILQNATDGAEIDE